MKRSFSSSPFGLSQDIPLTSPTMTPFLPCHSSTKSNFQANQSLVHHSEFPFDSEQDVLERHARDVPFDSKHDSPDHENPYSNRDHYASDLQQSYQREWNYQEICNHYRDSRQHLFMDQYQEDFLGNIHHIYSGNSGGIAYTADNNASMGQYVDMFMMYGGSVGVSPGAYLANSHFHDGAIAAAADSSSAIQTPSLSLETIETGLVIHHHSDSSHLYDQNHIHSLTVKPEEFDDELMHIKKKSTTTQRKPLKKTSNKKLAKSSSRGGAKHVGKACTHCKKAHLACDNARPCKRCVHLGKEDCIDVEHKRRGRPRTSPEKRDSVNVISVAIDPNLDLKAAHGKYNDQLIALAAE